MGVTVSDCLNFAALQDATVIAGQSGLGRIISSVSVLEYADVEYLKKDIFWGSELIITGLISIKDDLKKQRKLLKLLSERGVAGLVIYYVGVFLLDIDEKLIQDANQLKLPLIIMPRMRTDLRYTDVIFEVMQHIIIDRIRETDIAGSVLEMVSQLPERKRTLTNVLRILSDRLQCTFLVMDRNIELLGVTTWPASAEDSYENIYNACRQYCLQDSREDVIELNGEKKNILHTVISSKSRMSYHVVSLSSNNSIAADIMVEVEKILHLFLMMWQSHLVTEDRHSLIPSILSNEQFLMRQIIKNARIDTLMLKKMWIISNRNGDYSINTQHVNASYELFVKSFMEDRGKYALIETYEDCIVVLMDSAAVADLDAEIEDEFFEAFHTQYDKTEGNVALVAFSPIQKLNQIREYYNIFLDTRWIANAIFPRYRVYGLYDLNFAQKCKEILSDDDSVIQQVLSPLNPLIHANHPDDLVETLTVFLLDASGNIQKTADIMYLHKNSIKYRIYSIKRYMNYDITKMPAAYDLYLAVALNRLIDK